jgi:hypothetical protein
MFGSFLVTFCSLRAEAHLRAVCWVSSIFLLHRVTSSILRKPGILGIQDALRPRVVWRRASQRLRNWAGKVKGYQPRSDLERRGRGEGVPRGRIERTCLGDFERQQQTQNSRYGKLKGEDQRNAFAYWTKQRAKQGTARHSVRGMSLGPCPPHVKAVLSACWACVCSQRKSFLLV